MSDEQGISKADVRALIDEVFEHYPMPHVLRLETDYGFAIRFGVHSKRLGF